ncbi:MAG: N(4)-(beta-N-acetylglucosaminyl)-L-asparaginase [Candidatus Bathyarchaeota archaeon]|nr:N(4)-(beta-N-acetylglucosaminyl)-L-asparaginase [Candidatus Bathyarchaeota archaeon]
MAKVKPFIIGTRNAGEFLYAGAAILRKGGSAIDAVEASTKLVEANPKDDSVGYAGIPNLLGKVELDASIMDGKTLRTGAVGAVKGYLHVISIARMVMEKTPHVMLVGSGAELFAKAMGFKKQNLLTKDAKEKYQSFLTKYSDLPKEGEKPWYVNYDVDFGLRGWYDKLTDKQHGTVNIMAIDGKGNICSGVSTSGTAFKFPGRLGDSPIIGAGNYCDNRFGAAACTGRGELAIRLSLARTLVSYMENGLTVREACARGMKDINELGEKGGMNCLAMDNKGNTMSASTSKENIHWYMDIDSKEAEQRKGIYISE